MGENLTFTVRKMLFAGIIYKDISWFDSKEKAPGVLSNVLSEDVTLLNGLSTESIAIILEALLTLALGIIIGAILSWRMALITIALMPTIVLGGAISNKLTAKSRGAANPSGTSNKNITEKKDEDYYAESNALQSDLIMNYRTVISFGPKNISFLIQKYNNLLNFPKRASVKMAHQAGIAFGYSFFIRFAFIGVVFYIASYIINKYHLPAKENYIAVFVLFISALGAGNNVSNVPSVAKAKDSAKSIFA